MEKIPSPHDRFFRVAMSEHRVAKAFFEQHLPETIRKIVDLNTLRLLKESFIDPQLKLVITDMLFSADFAGKPGYLYLLAEHRSTPSHWQAFTMLVYIVRIMEQHRKEAKENKVKEKYLPLVYPVVFFNGENAYPYSTDLLDLFDHPRELVQQILFQPFQLIDLNAISDEVLKTNVWTSIMHIMMKHVYARDVLPYVEGLVTAWQEVDQNGGENYIAAAFNYLFATSEVRNPNTLVEVIQEILSTDLREKVMTIAQQFEEQGRQKGLQEGRQEGMTIAQQFEEQGRQKGLQEGRQERMIIAQQFEEQGRQKGLQEGEERGHRKGEINKAKLIAIKLLQKGMSADQVAQLTELPLDMVGALEVEKISTN